MDSRTLVMEADRAAAGGDLNRAVELLTEASQDAPGDGSIWMRLAGLHRAGGRPKLALDAVHRALESAPLDFMALMMRASLLDRLGSPEAPQAWSHALAQKPAGELPPQIAALVQDAEGRQESWLTERDERMKAAVSGIEAPASEDERSNLDRFRTNILRKTRPYHSQPTDFAYPGLAEREFHPRRLFPWLSAIEAATHDIREELKVAMAAERAELVPYVQYQDHEPLDQWRELNKNPDWTAIHLLRNGDRVEANARHCPATLSALEQVPQPEIGGAGPNAMFSLLAPETRIPAHVGVNNARLVCHLPLIVPQGCWFRVGAETRYWHEGEAFVFDDTIEHEAYNPTQELRVVFIFDVWHPDLSATEREAVKAIIEADGAVTVKSL